MSEHAIATLPVLLLFGVSVGVKGLQKDNGGSQTHGDRETLSVCKQF